MKCDDCGSSEIEVDSSRGDAVCMNCGKVLGANIIVSEVQFEEGKQGSTRAIGQFVSSDSKGVAGRLGANLNFRATSDSREITLKKARRGIEMLCNNLMLSNVYVDIACNFFKMVLIRNLTKGRKNSHVYAACVYLTCRIEGTGHLLIDISDILHICCFELGRTYLKLSQQLCLNIPAIDPCIYILRFASKLDFGVKTQMVANTALRLVQRMKRDSIHSGRKPTGLCGAALLMAARLHEFGRSTSDIVKIVKVHESTLRKRLIEFGETPSSALTLDEFMTVDLEAEQDPPSFKAARKKDKERLQRLIEDEPESIKDLQKQIEVQLELDRQKRPRHKIQNDFSESEEAEMFIEDSIKDTINNLLPECTDNEVDNDLSEVPPGLGPNIESMGLPKSLDDTSNAPQAVSSITLDVDLDLNDIDDDEIDSYMVSEKEYLHKQHLWQTRNAKFLEEQKEREERLKQEGKQKKRKRTTTKKSTAARSAKEAIEKILQEKKISSKINYDVLKCLSAETPTPANDKDEPVEKRMRLSSVSSTCSQASSVSINKVPSPKKKISKEIGLPLASKPDEKEEGENIVADEEDYDEEETEDNQQGEEMGVLQMFQQYKSNDNGDENEFYGYDEYE